MERNSAAGLIALVAITSAFTIGLHQLGGVNDLSVNWADPIGWATRSTPEDVTGAVLRHVGLILGYYVLVTISICLLTGRRGRVSRPRWVDFLTLPLIRRIVDRALSATLAISIVGMPIGPAVAEQPPAPIVFERSSDGIPVPHVRMTTDENPVTSPPAVPATSVVQVPIVAPPLPTATQAPLAIQVDASPEDRHTVEQGDNLWTIAESRLSSALGTEPTTSQISDYWRLIIATNRGTLRSGDPNLIYPGEIIALPATMDTP